MITTITIIILSAFTFIAVLILGRVAYVSERRSAVINNLKDKIKRYHTAAKDNKPYYTIRKITPEESENEGNKVWAVCRVSFKDGYYHTSCIKIFTDNDDEFNRTEAEELCEKLNS